VARLYRAANGIVGELLKRPLVAGQVHPLATPAGQAFGAALREFRHQILRNDDLRAAVQKSDDPWHELAASDELAARLMALALSPAAELPPASAPDVPGQAPLFPAPSMGAKRATMRGAVPRGRGRA
jgi:hypothetical protein